MDQDRDGQGRISPSLMEGNQGHQKVHPRQCPQKIHHRRRPQWTQGFVLFLVAGCSLQAGPCPTGGIRLVGFSILFSQTLSSGFPAQCWCLQNKGLLYYRARKDPSLSLDAAVLCREIRGADQSPLWHCEGTPEVHGPSNEPQWGQNGWSLTLGTNRQWTWNLPNPRRGSCTCGGRNMSCWMPQRPQDHSRNIQEPISPRNLPSRLTLWVPLLLHPLFQDPANTFPGKQRNTSKGVSNWIGYYIEKSGKIPNWCWEFQSICHPGAKPLNDIQV